MGVEDAPCESGGCNLERSNEYNSSVRATSIAQVLDRHEASKTHMEASTRSNIISSTLVPPMAQFTEVWDAMGSGIFSCRALARRCKIGKAKAYKFKKCFAKASMGV